MSNLCTVDAKHNTFEAASGRDVEQIWKVYKEQIPSLFDKGMSTDRELLIILAVGRAEHFDYLS